jgi:hypothetical protein
MSISYSIFGDEVDNALYKDMKCYIPFKSQKVHFLGCVFCMGMNELQEKIF